ncbi:ShlB/FhaC/HecB family hemolysin secretion/activation protein [Burkholderia pyrrocinia]|uniref:ShlB/FhaC/HecB family hemolysin secretion/activation protein n=1 Tax=Burkholderia pyrrocinia TaxID=60550 RepID=UPI001FB33B88|nr:ShlB/FhaC/HecB family hemolysin secretion/activation protein [Burkholderia pyrrocinia]UOB58009.1 ShlB/FhaC/HecB family hemolysin secretion/activation protein [Burkholderia pyrrocinia]
MWEVHMQVVGHRRVDIDSVEAAQSREAGSQAVPRDAGVALRARHALCVALICGGAAGLVEQVHAQVPDAGRAMRDIETPRPDLPPETAPELKVTPSEDTAESAPESGPRVLVRAFALDGNTVFGSDKLLPLVADLAGSTLSFADLQRAAGRITAYYRRHGYVLARAYLPRQDIDDGVVRIEIAEGRYGAITIQNHSRVLDAALRQPLSALHPGDVVRGPDLERSLLLLDDLAGVGARGTLRPGETPGTTDLVVDADKGPLASGSLEFDNFGDVALGRYRLGGSIDVNSPLRLGDRLSLRGLISNERQRYYRAAYQVPVGPASTRVGVAYSSLRYRLGGAFSDLDSQGRASVQTAYVTQPLVRARALSVTAQVQYENKNLRDDYGVFDIRRDKNVGLWTFGVSGNSQDGLLGGGRNGFSVMFGVGRLRSNDPFEADSLKKSIGSFAKLNVSALRVQALGRRLELYTQFSAQLASRNLDESEKFSLGGPYGVRAYALGAGSGDQGWQASAELRYLVAPGWQVSTFVDAGRVQGDKHPWTRERNMQHMQAGGVGASWYGAKRQVTLTAAWPLGAATGSPTRAPSVWVQAAQYF